MEKKENASKLISSLVALSLATTLGVPTIALADTTDGTGSANAAAAEPQNAESQENESTSVSENPFSVNGSSYSTLQEAINNAESGSTITVMNDCEVAGLVEFSKDLVLDLNGKSITAKGTEKGFWGNVNDGITLTIIGSGYLGDPSGESVGYLLYPKDNSSLIIDSTATFQSGLSVVQVSGANVKLDIRDGNFIGGTYKDKYWTINILDQYASSASMLFSGGAFKGFNPESGGTENPDMNFCAPGYKAVKKDDGYIVEWDQDNVASIDSSDGIKYGYKTLGDAIAAASDGDTITVLADTTVSSDLTSIDKNLVLDFGGNTVSFTAAGFDVGCKKQNTSLTLKNGTMNVAAWGIWLQNDARLNVASDMTITANSAKNPKSYGIVVTQGSTLDMYGTVKAKATGAISGNGTEGWGNTTINVYPGANVIGEEGAIGIYHPQSGTLNIKGGTIEGDMGIQLCAGEGTVAEIGNATIEGTGTDERGSKGVGDGVIPDGAAVSIVNRNYPGGTPIVNIKGGTLTSTNQKAVFAYDWSNGEASAWSAATEPAIITGGTFSSEPDASYIADGYEAVKSGANWVVQVPYTPAPAPTTETTTTTNPDGTTTTTVTDKKTGESTSTTEGANGTTVVEKTDASGNTTTKVTVPEGTATNAGAPVEIPAAVEVTKGKEVSISAPAGTIVAIPAAADAGNVAVIVHADGTETVIPMSLVEGGKAIVKLDGDETIKIVDNAKDFSDVPAEHWAADDIDFASSHEIFKGIGNGDTYEPETALTRNMMMTVLARTAGADTEGGDPWYAKGQQWAVENGVSNGLWGEDSITREQLVTMLFNYANKAGLDTSARADISGMENASAVSDWATEAVRWAVAEGILKGVDNTDLAPQGLATRAQAAAFMQRYVKAALL